MQLKTALYHVVCNLKKQATQQRKLLRIMRLTAILLLSACMVASAKGHTQQITIREKNISLEKLFKEIRKQTGYVFFYDATVVANSKPVTINVRNGSIEEVLKQSLNGQNLDFSIENKTITIVKAKSPNENTTDVSLNLSKTEVRPPIDVHGRVTNENGEPVVATVQVKGTNNGTTTNSDGYFELKGVDDNATLVISAVNIETREIKLNGRNDLSVVSVRMKITNMNEVVINKGYYSTTQRLNTGNVSTVKASDIEKQPVSNPLLALEGRVPGMVVTQQTGLPGSGVVVQIRGQNSIAQGNLPLYIIDGVPYISDNPMNLGGNILGNSGSGGDKAGNPLSYLNPLDIESIDVLKDADATAIYGTRGANGVILITTKKGKAGKVKVNVNVQSGFGKVARKVSLLNTRQYLDMRYEAFKNDGVNIIPSSAYDLTLWDTTRYTDWQKELIGGTAKYNDYQVSLSGGNLNTNYLVSAGYHNERTVFPGDFRNKKASVHFNLNSTSANQRFHFLLSSLFMYNDNRIPSSDLTQYSLSLAPDAPELYNTDGTINWQLLPSGTASWSNPIAVYMTRLYKTQTNNLISNSMLSYNLLKGLDLKCSFGYNNIQTSELTTIPSVSWSPSFRASQGINARSSTFLNNYYQSWIVEPQIDYTSSIAKGQLSILIGFTIQQNKSTSQRINAQGFSSDLLIENPNAAATFQNAGSSFAIYKYNAAFGRLSYDWDEKYLINITARRDGTSRFGPASRFHNFEASGIGWIFSKESFIQKNMSFLSFGKLRASYGTTGSDAVGDYAFMDLYNTTSAGVPYQGTVGLQITRLYTPDLAWEETKKLEVGLELGFVRDKILVTISHYRNRSSNQLVGYTLPYTAGFTSITKNLNAVVENKGWEFIMNTTNFNNKYFRWTSSFNIFWNRNKLVSADPGISASYKPFIGSPLSSQYIYDYAGVDPITGLYEFFDSKGNPTSTPNTGTQDRTVLFTSTPKFSGGFQNNIQYQRFELDFFLQFTKQTGMNFLYNSVPGSWSSNSGNQPITVLSRWQKPGDQTNIQRFNQDKNSTIINPYNAAQSSNQLFTDISFIRLKNISVSWQVPNRWVKAAKLQNFNLYMQGQNLYSWTKYKGLDPETKSTTSLPPLRVITFGIRLNF
jgi:TonB-linked SusC/RagA family outer membrane protein